MTWDGQANKGITVRWHTVDWSLEKRFKIRPAGVVWKNESGALQDPFPPPMSLQKR